MAIAAAVAPLAVIPGVLSVGLFVLLRSLWVSDPSETLNSVLGSFFITSLFGVPIAYVLMLAVGLPMAVVARKLRRTSLGLAIVAGALVGAVTALLLKHGRVELPSFLYMVWVGAFVASVFKAIVTQLETRLAKTSARGAV
ncbi:MAG: hypothetical protein ABI837_21560 [Acidobacteriota bacterium]